MNDEILVELFTVNDQLRTITWVFGGILAILAVSVFLRLYDLWKLRGNTTYRNAIENFYNRGSFSVVINGCEEKIKRHPHDAWAYWWKGKAHMKLGELESSRDSFRKLYALEPGWRHSIQPYLTYLDKRESLSEKADASESSSELAPEGESRKAGQDWENI